MTEQCVPRVGVVDDDTAVRDSLCFLLEAAGIAVASYGSADQFLADDDADDMDCLVLDQQMPVLTGLELLAWLRRGGVAIPAVLITGSPSPALTRRARALGGCQVMEKPFAGRDLLSIISTACATETRPPERPGAGFVGRH